MLLNSTSGTQVILKWTKLIEDHYHLTCTALYCDESWHQSACVVFLCFHHKNLIKKCVMRVALNKKKGRSKQVNETEQEALHCGLTTVDERKVTRHFKIKQEMHEKDECESAFVG